MRQNRKLGDRSSCARRGSLSLCLRYKRDGEERKDVSVVRVACAGLRSLLERDTKQREEGGRGGHVQLSSPSHQPGSLSHCPSTRPTSDAAVTGLRAGIFWQCSACLCFKACRVWWRVVAILSSLAEGGREARLLSHSLTHIIMPKQSNDSHAHAHTMTCQPRRPAP